MIDEDRSTWTLGQLADEVIEACELPTGCRGTIIAALGDAKDQGAAELRAYAVALTKTARNVADFLDGGDEGGADAWVRPCVLALRAAVAKGSDDGEVRSPVVGGAQLTQAGGDSGGMPLSVGRSRPDQTATSSCPETCHTDHPLRHWDRTCPACVHETNAERPEPHDCSWCKTEHEGYSIRDCDAAAKLRHQSCTKPEPWLQHTTTALREIADLAERSLDDGERGREAIEIAERELCRQHEDDEQLSLALALGRYSRHQVGRVSLPADLPGYAMTLEDALRHAAKLPPERCHAFVLEALKRIPERAEQLEFVACNKQGDPT